MLTLSCAGIWDPQSQGPHQQGAFHPSSSIQERRTPTVHPPHPHNKGAGQSKTSGRPSHQRSSAAAQLEHLAIPRSKGATFSHECPSLPWVTRNAKAPKGPSSSGVALALPSGEHGRVGRGQSGRYGDMRCGAGQVGWKGPAGCHRPFKKLWTQVSTPSHETQDY